MSVAKQTSTSIDAEKVAFIEAALKNGVLLFGEFTLKSGRYVILSQKHQVDIYTYTNRF